MKSATELLAERFPALAKYCPNLSTISEPQALFLLLDCREAFYGGAAGGGKSDALLMAALQYADVPGYAALLLRRTYAELEKADGLIPRAEEWLARTDARRQDGGRKWVFPSGARLEFGHCENESNKFAFQSAAYQFIGFDELTSFTESIYEYIGFSRSRRRVTGKVAKVPIRVRSASNPGNVGHGWVKARFVDEATRRPGVVFIPAKVSDNPGLDAAEYVETMAALPDALRAQLLEGDWDAFQGMAYPEFSQRTHVVEPFPIPEWWERFESMDHGVASPTAWLAWAADGDGNLVVFAEHYRENALVSEHARIVSELRKRWHPPRVVPPVWADPSTGARSGAERWGRPASVKTEYAEHGIILSGANNDRAAGYARLLELIHVEEGRLRPEWAPLERATGSPRLFVFSTCRNLIDQLRSAPVEDEGENFGIAVKGRWESEHGHAHAACRYGAMSWQLPAERPAEAPPDDPRTAFIWRLLRRDDHDGGDLARHFVY